METKLLNEYLMADLLNRYSQNERRRRQQKMEAEGLSQDEINATPVTQEDHLNAFALLEYYRTESLRLLQESSGSVQK